MVWVCGQHMLTQFCKVAAGLLRNKRFEYFIASLIICNAVTIGLRANWCLTHLKSDAPPVYRIIDIFFTIAFFFELCLRIVAEQLSDAPIIVNF